jgi:hypothetical protein
MKMKSACELCKTVFAPEEKHHIFGEKTICSACLIKQSESGNICPACKNVLDAEKEEVGLVLTKPDAPHRELMAEPVAMVIVCPHCRVLFFDTFQYEILRGFRETVARLEVR